MLNIFELNIMATSMAKLAKRKNDELYTPIILIEPIIKHLEKWAMDFTQKNKREPIVLCPFDLPESEFVRIIKHKWIIKYGHIETGEDFFTHNYGGWDICISNPPFSLKKKIFDKLFELHKPFALIANMMLLNYEEIGRLFSDYPIQILSFDRRISFDGNPSSFMSGYICNKFLQKDLIFEKLPNNNSGKYYIPSEMYLRKAA